MLSWPPDLNLSHWKERMLCEMNDVLLYGKFICIKWLCIIMFKTNLLPPLVKICISQLPRIASRFKESLLQCWETTKSCKLHLSVASVVKSQDASCWTGKATEWGSNVNFNFKQIYPKTAPAEWHAQIGQIAQINKIPLTSPYDTLGESKLKMQAHASWHAVRLIIGIITPSLPQQHPKISFGHQRGAQNMTAVTLDNHCFELQKQSDFF